MEIINLKNNFFNSSRIIFYRNVCEKQGVDLNPGPTKKPRKKTAKCPLCPGKRHLEKNCPRRNKSENLTSVEYTVDVSAEEHIHYLFPDNHIDEVNEEKSVDNETINEEDRNMDEIDIDDDVVNDDNNDIDNLHWQEIPIWDPTLLETRNGTINRSSCIPVFDETTTGPNIRYIHRIHRTQKSKNSISAIDCLLCYFTTPTMSEFVNSTNSFGKLFLNKWKDTNMSEFMIFLQLYFLLVL